MADVGQVSEMLPRASTRRICRLLGVARSALYRPHVAASTDKQASIDDPALVARIKALIEQHPTYGYRRIWARLRCGDKRVINKKNVRRILLYKGELRMLAALTRACARHAEV